MIRRLFLASLMLASVALAALVAWAMLRDEGYVLLAWDQFRYQSTIWVFLLVCAVLWFLLFSALRGVYALLVSYAILNPWSKRNNMRRIERATQRGFIELSAGHWEHALRLLGRAALLGEQPLTAYLGAARAASELGELDKCEKFLQSALKNDPKSKLAVELTRAQLQIDRGDDSAARETLQAIRERRPRHAPTLRLLLALLERQQDWAALSELLPNLRRQNLISEEQADQVELMARCAVLRAAGAGDDSLLALQRTWSSLPKKARMQPEMLACQSALLMRAGAVAEAEALLREALKRHCDDKLLALYVQTGNNPQQQLTEVEGWLSKQSGNAMLLLAAGRLAMRCENWDKARSYLEQSLEAERRAEACTELARLLASRFGEAERSNQLFQEGLELMARQSAEPLPVNLPAPLKPGTAGAAEQGA